VATRQVRDANGKKPGKGGGAEDDKSGKAGRGSSSHHRHSGGGGGAEDKGSSGDAAAKSSSKGGATLGVARIDLQAFKEWAAEQSMAGPANEGQGLLASTKRKSAAVCGYQVLLLPLLNFTTKLTFG
jgi:hypothetical protein